MNQKTKVCPNCHRENEADALYCTWKCGYKWLKPELKPEPKPVTMTQEIRDAFFDFSENILTQIKKEINDYESRQQPVTYIFGDTDDQLRDAYKEYTANFRQLVATMDNIALMSKQIDDKYNACLGETEGANNAQIDYIRLKYEQVQNKVKEALSVLVNNVLEIDPFCGVINYQISPLERWKTIKASEPRFPQRYNYVGCVNYDYNILGIPYHLFCHQFIELLNANNLIVHYNNASKQLAINVVKTLLARMLHISQGMHLKVGVIDTSMGQGFGGRFNDLPKDIYTFYGPQDSSLIREYLINFEVNADNLMSNVLSNTTAENYNKHSSNPVDNEVAVLLDWNSCLQESVNGILVRDIIRKSARTGKCVIVMVNDDTPYAVNRRSGEDELLPELEKSSIQLDVKEANETVGALKKLSWDYETIDDDALKDVVKVVRNKHAETKRKNTIDIVPVLKKQLEYGGNSSLGLSFVVGKNESYQDVTLELEDGGPGASLLVSANHNSELLLPWVQALIAQAMAQYKPEELKLVFADFTDDDVVDGLFDKNVETPPYYYYSGDGVQNKLRSCLEKHKTQGQGRMLVFLNCDYVGCSDFVNNYSCLNKIHLILIERHNEQCLMSYSDWHNHFINFGPIWDYKWHIEKNQFELEESLCTAYSWDNVSELKELIEDWAESYRIEHPDEIVIDEDDDEDEEDMGYENIEQNDIEENNIPSFEDLDEEMTEMDIVDSKTDEDTTNDNDNSNSNEMVVTDEAVEHGQTDAVESSSAEAQVEPTKTLLDQIVETPLTEVKIVVVPMKKEEAPAKKPAKKKKTTKKQTTEFGYQRTILLEEHLPKEEDWWQNKSDNRLAVPFGVHINQKGQDVEKSFVFENVDQKNAALVVGGAGSGKTAFIHTFILSAACRYSPEELELYLIDLKGMGTGFYPFEKCHLPHVKVIYNGTDREFPLSVLKRIEHEVKVVRPAKNKRGEKYPRILLIIDESPVLFSEEDYIYNEAKRIINGINGLGREAKVNIMLSTQVLGNIPKKTWEQVAIRYVGCPPPGVMDTNNTLLGQSAKITANFTHGEAVFVERGMPTGDIENYHVKSYYIDAEHDNPTDVERIVQRLDAHAKLHPEECPNYGKCITFHHDEIVDFLVNERMSYEHSQPQNQTSLPSSVPLYVGSPVELAEHDVYFELQPADNNNVLIIGTVPDDSILGQSIALNMLRSGVMAYPKEQELRTDYVFDFSSPNASLHGGVEYFLGGKPFSKSSAIIPNKEDEVVKKLKEVCDECDRRRKENVVPCHIYLTFLALEKANMFGTPNNIRKDATKCLKKLIEEGPKYGIFLIVQMIANSKRVRDYLGIPSFDCINHYVISKMGEEAKTMFPLFGRTITKLYDEDSVSCKEPSSVGLYRCLYFNFGSSSVKKFKPYNPIQNIKHNESD